MSSYSQRLQPLTRLEQLLNKSAGWTYTNNPSIAPHPAQDALRQISGDSSSEYYALNIQVSSYRIIRRQIEPASYDVGAFNWATHGSLLTMRVQTSGSRRFSKSPDHFELDYNDGQFIKWYNEQDMRLVPYNNSLLTYGGNAWTDVLEIKPNVSADGLQSSWHQAAKMPRRYRDLWWAKGWQKNWIAIRSHGKLYWLTQFRPFKVANCGLPHLARQNCDIEVFLSLNDSLVPESASNWRGSGPMLPLPRFPRLQLGMTHERSKRVKGMPFSDTYSHRFYLVDTDAMRPFAFSEPFTFFSAYEDCDWFEFVIGMATWRDTELLIPFCFNDQEAWIAILPIAPIIRSLTHAYESNKADLEDVQYYFR
ncbi:MAG: hypothetical protein CYPHOPRED_004776 [Cyphobasidiales sp. Tagirdzhanova-0007]|nr:MAG: hypothetical protein CYPHOPRED_004776 [Cyphobasidiales sp. Tagirdzhanova-0007]